MNKSSSSLLMPLFLSLGFALVTSSVQSAPAVHSSVQTGQAAGKRVSRNPVSQKNVIQKPTSQKLDQDAAHLAQVKKQALAIKLGMSRAEVSKVFPQQGGGLVGSDIARYYTGGSVMVDVPFDENGGAFSPQNRVSRPPTVYHSSFHAN